MAVNARQYRDHLYRLRSHPGDHHRHPDFVDKRDNLFVVYLSAIPFLGLEYMAERAFDFMPSGLICPFGYLLFWAFYFTYYRPGFLEDKLTSPKQFHPSAIVGVLLGVLIWFVKVTVVELSHLFFLHWIFEKKPAGQRPPPKRPPGFRPGQGQTGSYSYRERTQTGSHNTNHGHTNHGAHSQQHAQRPPGGTGGTYYGPRPGAAPPPPRQPPLLPPDVRAALEVLGLAPTRDWHEIHKRYRELAKRFHPDLNREITEVGKRFIRIDTAYRKLVAVKARYFIEKRP